MHNDQLILSQRRTCMKCGASLSNQNYNRGKYYLCFRCYPPMKWKTEELKQYLRVS